MEPLTRKKIVFVDDEEDWRGAVSACLTQAGYEVLAARNASEAMRRAEEPGIALIIVDEDLAGESGIMLASFLHENHPEVPTMLYTSMEHDPGEVLDMMSQGAVQCLTKGSMEELVLNVGCSAN